MKFSTKWLWLFLFVMTSLTGCRTQDAEIIWEEEVQEEMTEAVSESLISQMAEASIFQESTESRQIIFVDICGAVAHPGVYELNEGARLFEAIEHAGGLLEEADDTAINRAEILTDGCKIIIYTKDEMKERKEAGVVIQAQTQQDAPLPTTSGKVNINTADEATLTTLPGIGTTRAADIVAYRNDHGGFQSIEEIMNVNGIKEGTFRKIEDKITTE